VNDFEAPRIPGVQVTGDDHRPVVVGELACDRLELRAVAA
jgi:hypothetical protein